MRITDSSSKDVGKDQDALLRLLLWVNAAGIVLTLSSLVLPLGWISATAATGLGLVCFSGYVVLRGFPRWSTNLYLFGLLCGWVELWADQWLVQETKTLRYATGGPFVVASPLYMPFAWGGLLSGSVLLLALLARRLPRRSLLLVSMTLTGVYIPLYEYLACEVGWWQYQNAPILFGIVPSYIVLGEVLIGFPLTWLALRFERASHVEASLWGALVGGWIFVCYKIAFALVGPSLS